MTGRDKLIEWAKNADAYHVCLIFRCPSVIGIDHEECDGASCIKCWENALKTECEEQR